MTILWFAVCAAEMPVKAHTITSPYATSFLVASTIKESNRAIIMISDAQVSWFIPRPFQMIETNAVATFAMEAIVIQPKYVLKGR